MSPHPVPTEALVLNFALYVCLPAWVIFGFVDYLCHRASSIETTSGLNESIIHSVMGVQVGLAIFLGLYLEITVATLLLMLAVVVLHEWVAHHDVKTARVSRPISMTEMHAHSFLESIPFMLLGLVICLRWPVFLDLVTLHWAGGMSLRPKDVPIDPTFVRGYFLMMFGLGILPYTEELWRCWRHRPAA